MCYHPASACSIILRIFNLKAVYIIIVVKAQDFNFVLQGGAEFVFPTDSKKKRSWGEQMFSGIGTSYMCGMLSEHC